MLRSTLSNPTSCQKHCYNAHDHEEKYKLASRHKKMKKTIFYLIKKLMNV